MDFETNDLNAAIEAGKDTIDLGRQLQWCGGEGDDDIPLLLLRDGQQAVVQKDLLAEIDRRRPAPLRRFGTETFTEVESFIAQVLRYKDEGTVVHVDPQKARFRAILNYNLPGAASGPRWGDHVALYNCPFSRQWLTWTAASGKSFSQDDFAEFLEANYSDMVEDEEQPTARERRAAPARILELARSLVVHSGERFERTVNPTTGEFTFNWKNESDASTKVPRAFTLGLPVFNGGKAYRIEARIRMTLREGKASFGFVLDQPERFIEHALGEVRAQVADQTQVPLFAATW